MKDLTEYPDAHLRVFDRPPLPDQPSGTTIYLIGICGTGMGSLAGLLREAGHEVSGSDAATYPPMSTRLEEMGVPVIEGFDASNFREPFPDLVVVGNACTPTHPEASRARDLRLAQASLPEALAHFFLRHRRSLVIAGTHGKTTTTGMLIHLLRESGHDPGFLVGGVMLDGDASYAVGTGGHFVIEGDEYDSAYFDKRPKFMHYMPTSAVVTSMEFDHADIYDDWDDYRDAFREFASIVSKDGVLALNGDDPHVRDLANYAAAQVRSFGIEGDELDVRATNLETVAEGSRFNLEIDGADAGTMLLSMGGRHNVLNALAALTIGLSEDLNVETMASSLASFRGMKRRQEVRGRVAGITIVDDFAHHPTAVRETISAVRGRWPGRRILAAFEPRSNSSRRKVFESEYVDAFTGADMVFISRPPFRHNDSESNFMSVDNIETELTGRGVKSAALDGPDAVLESILDAASAGDVVLIMSNGGFGGIHDKLLKELATRQVTP
ncbi:MAG: UDP-N-acetylmuramate:L-alanyl-gamma-D-glutamyl-meso-diaminopimelate ligase [Rhodothermia bacterium]|nr:UDP-N-acetylmuramate:L-alanyl-gamma-D-glutamyl-meso-diaminopimelate ligase [Rhodothermia bacterium]